MGADVHVFGAASRRLPTISGEFDVRSGKLAAGTEGTRRCDSHILSQASVEQNSEAVPPELSHHHVIMCHLFGSCLDFIRVPFLLTF